MRVEYAVARTPTAADRVVLMRRRWPLRPIGSRADAEDAMRAREEWSRSHPARRDFAAWGDEELGFYTKVGLAIEAYYAARSPDVIPLEAER